MTEISEFEKQLNPAKSFEQHITILTLDLAWHLYKQDTQKFFDQWNAWVQDLPQDVLNVDLLRKVEKKYFLRADVSPDDVPDYKYIIQACGIYAAAAQRAHNRTDSFAAWNLLTEANLILSKVNSNEKELAIQDQKAAKSVRSLVNADSHGQRVRYQIIALLHRDHHENQVKFKSVKLAIERIDFDIGQFLIAKKLRISYVDLVPNVKNWIKDHSAFRAEMSPFFVAGVIPT